MPMLSIIISTYNGLSYLRQCIDVLRMYNLPFCEFIVVDNESTDGTGEWLAEQQNVNVIDGKYSWGLAKSFNEGRKIAEGEFLLFMHNDVVCTKEVVPTLLETVKMEGVAAAGPLANRCMHYKQFVHADNYQNLDEMHAFAASISSNREGVIVEPCLFLESFCMMVKAVVFDEVGGFDERFSRAGFEGIDLSFRITKAGYWVCTASVYVHHGQGSRDAEGCSTSDVKAREEELFQYKWGKDNWNINLVYSSSIRYELLKHINLKQPGLSVMELGCALGGNLMHIKWHNREAKLFAFELNPSTADVAGSYGNVAAADVEKIDFEELKERFDYVIAGDLIEHLRDPWNVVKKIAGTLKSNGKFIVSIPNVSHISVICNLLLGRWDYTDAGLLDRTHLRFFTRDTMFKMMAEAGLTVEGFEYNTVELPQAIMKIMDTLTNMPDLPVSKMNLEAYQIFIKAVKK